MTNLSPATRSIWEAFNSKFDWVEDGVPGPQFHSVAAALRALTRTTLVDEGHMRGWVCRAITTEDILDIAAELEGADG